jgi:hypothetical protein
MSDLERIEREAQELTDKWFRSPYDARDSWKPLVDELIAMVKRMLDTFDFAAMERTADKMHQFAEERDQARADVLKTRSALQWIYDDVVTDSPKMWSAVAQALKDTEHYEQYRKD